MFAKLIRLLSLALKSFRTKVFECLLARDLGARGDLENLLGAVELEFPEFALLSVSVTSSLTAWYFSWGWNAMIC